MIGANVFGLMKGVVVDLDDPSGFRRVRVRIPALHGSFTDSFYPAKRLGKINRVEDEYLPWAEVNLPYGSTVNPEINQVVLVGFINGSSDQPVILGWLGYEYTPEEEPLVVRT